MAYTMAMLALKVAHFAGGTRSVIIVMPSAKHPPPPIPWKARKTMLESIGQRRDSKRKESDTTYSCTIVLAAPHAALPIMNIAMAVASTGFRPSISLSFANTTTTPACEPTN